MANIKRVAKLLSLKNSETYQRMLNRTRRVAAENGIVSEKVIARAAQRCWDEWLEGLNEKIVKELSTREAV